MSRGLLFSLLSLLLILLVVKTCKGNINQNCHPSSCGNILNMSFPSRLKTDPEHCGHGGYELECENNTHTILLLNSMKFFVQSIDGYTIRVLDPGIRKNHCPPFSLHSFTGDDMLAIYTGDKTKDYIYIDEELLYKLNSHVTFISCPSRVESSRYVDTTTYCNTINNTSSNASWSSLKDHHFSYALLGDVLPKDVMDSCKIDGVAWFSDEFPVADNTSFLSILDSMVNGFSFRWYGGVCSICNSQGGSCSARWLRNGNIFVNCVNQYYSCLATSNCMLLFWTLYSQRLQKILGWSLLSRFVCGILFLLMLLIYKYRRQPLSNDETIEHFLQGQNNLAPIRYKYRDIRNITKKFKEKLGEGGYGSVYKGKLRSGILVAVKMLNKSKATGQEFINEVATIGRIHHVNVVQLIGFCVEGSKRALVYEFMPSSSLDKYIFLEEEGRPLALSCDKMFKISLGVARGIDYLHRGCDMQILHFDIKPHNILLDQNFTPKISDFGLAKLYPTNDSIVSVTAARGTIGYMAPELFYKNIGGVSYKADVYSYGMLLMEMAGRRKNLNPFVENVSQIYFPSWVYDQFSKGKEIGTGDFSREEKTMVRQMIIIALWCIQMKPVDRPSMNKIVELLERDDGQLQMPPKPFLYPEQLPTEDHEMHANDNQLPLLSCNDIDSTTLDGDEN